MSSYIEEGLLTIIALVKYDGIIVDHVQKLQKCITKSGGHDIEIGQLLLRTSFDIMGTFGFGRSFNVLEEEDFHAIDMLKRFMRLLGPLSPVPWLCRIGIQIPVVSDPWWSFKNWCHDMCRERLQVVTPRDSVSSRKY